MNIVVKARTLRARVIGVWSSVSSRKTAGEATEAAHITLGRAGEERAIDFLTREGYNLVATNVEVPIGRTRRGAEVKAEIDIVAYDGATLCFIEVKTRRTDDFARPEANVDLRKQRQISRAARRYRRLLDITADAFRYDVVSVLLPDPEAAARIQLLRSFWTDEKFRKRRWENSG